MFPAETTGAERASWHISMRGAPPLTAIAVRRPAPRRPAHLLIVRPLARRPVPLARPLRGPQVRPVPREFPVRTAPPDLRALRESQVQWGQLVLLEPQALLVRLAPLARPALGVLLAQLGLRALPVLPERTELLPLWKWGWSRQGHRAQRLR